MTDTDANKMFNELCGEQLSAVTFVQDYLQLWFDGPGINVTSQLTVQTATSHVSSWQAGFRDAVCAQIAKIVASVEFAENQELAILFSDGSAISVSLRPEHLEHGEAIYAHGFRAGIWTSA